MKTNTHYEYVRNLVQLMTLKARGKSNIVNSHSSGVCAPKLGYCGHKYRYGGPCVGARRSARRWSGRLHNNRDVCRVNISSVLNSL